MSSRITYPPKTNDPSAADLNRKYFATEADQVKEVVNSHATDIETLQQQVNSNGSLYYGTFTSLSVLQNAYPTAEEGAWAIINEGIEVDPQIALWNDDTSEWELAQPPTIVAATPAWENIYFGSGAFINTSGDSTTSAELIAHINSVGFTITAGKLIVIQIYVKRQINGASYMVRELYLFTKNNISGTWGTVSTNGAITFSDIIFINQATVSAVDNSTEVIELGSIGATQIHTYINSLDPATITWEDLEDDTDYFFSCIYDGNQQIYKYVGDLPVTVGFGNTTLLVTDFDLIYTEGETPSIGSASKPQRFTATDGQTEFILSDNPTDVSVPNVNRRPACYGIDYFLEQHTPTIKKVRFASGLPVNSYVEIIKYY